MRNQTKKTTMRPSSSASLASSCLHRVGGNRKKINTKTNLKNEKIPEEQRKSNNTDNAFENKKAKANEGKKEEGERNRKKKGNQEGRKTSNENEDEETKKWGASRSEGKQRRPTGKSDR